MPQRRRPSQAHARLRRLIIVSTKTIIVLTVVVGAWLWLVHRDWLLIALGAWGALALAVVIRLDRRHTREEH